MVAFSPSRFGRRVLFLFDFLLWFLAALAPLMFLAAFLFGFDQVMQHRGLLADLEAHGKTVWARVDKIEPEERGGRIYLFYEPESGPIELAIIAPLEFYPAAWVRTLEPGQSLEILWVPPGPYRHACQAVPRIYYESVRHHLGLTREVISIFLFFLLVVVVRPHFLFLGFVPFEQILDKALLRA